jgi:preprotein translocase subunit SecD
LYFVVLFAHIDLYKTSQPPFGWFRIMQGAVSWFNVLLVAGWMVGFARPSFAAETPTQPTSEAPSEPEPKTSKKSKKEKPKLNKSLRVYVETKHDIEERSLPAVVGRSSPMKFMVEKLPILNEVHVESAALLDQPGSFQVQVKFNSLGARILESYTAAAAGRHLLIMTEINKEGRWIAAPLIRRRLGNGILVFTPDASREDMDLLVRGLNQMVEKNRKQWLN